MADSVRIIGVHPVSASEPCYLLEIEIEGSSEHFDFGSVTQEIQDQPKSNWQVAYDEQPSPGDTGNSRWVFFFHYLDFKRPLLTSCGRLEVPVESPIPEHLKEIEYFEP